jgi:hypothetical protein
MMSLRCCRELGRRGATFVSQVLSLAFRSTLLGPSTRFVSLNTAWLLAEEQLSALTRHQIVDLILNQGTGDCDQGPVEDGSFRRMET